MKTTSIILEDKHREIADKHRLSATIRRILDFFIENFEIDDSGKIATKEMQIIINKEVFVGKIRIAGGIIQLADLSVELRTRDGKRGGRVSGVPQHR